MSITGAVVEDRVSRALEAAKDHLLRLQREEGYWWGDLITNVCMEAEYVMLLHILEKRWPEREEQVRRYILSTQNDNGSWSIYWGQGGDLNATIEAYQALKMTGQDPESEPMTKARNYIREQGGIEKSRVFTRFWLALLGQYDWEDLPILPPEIMWFSPKAKRSIWDFGSWARPTVVALAILMAKRPVFPLPPEQRVIELERGVRPEPRIEGPASFYYRLDRWLHWYHRRGWHPGRERAVESAFQWLVDRQERDGSWGGIQPPWFYSLIVFKVLNRTDHPAFKKGFEGLEGFGVSDDGRWWFQACVSPTWDTGLAVLALRAAGVPASHPALVQAGQWLLDQQVLEVRGDWAVRRPKVKPGGWPFEFANDTYPDIDDTAIVLMALNQLDLPDDARRKRALTKGFRWMVGLQSQNGGWGAFDADNVKTWVSEIPFSDFGWVNDPPTEDVTGHVLESLGQFGYDDAWPVIDRAVKFLKERQEPDGAFFGRWGVNYIYGAGAVLPGLQAIQYDLSEPWVQKCLDWVEAHQNDDGGWGEVCDSYVDSSLRGTGPSTASQTAWATMALIAGGRHQQYSVQRGVAYLVAQQKGDGGWDEPQYTGTGFPKDFYINYALYRDIFPVLALARYQKALRGGQR
ncbi:squalene--hopene cyclase [Sulfobacillus sp. DSM 109850]|uniref:Squalene--hopene cyclase n=2 Tax=Sulfobacillus harzensis TaxID=2729629 RepID=A0A7Y0Q1Q2_9FIRM|nr:squalene--hopene cyclase [Sulfobacillus harzensis]